MEERDTLCSLEAEESELETEVEELRRMVAAGGDPMTEEVIEEGKQGVVATWGRSRFGGKRRKRRSWVGWRLGL